MKKIYLDHSATTPMDKKVFEAIRPYFTNKFGNPSSIHSFGQEALMAVDKAREKIAEFLNCEPNEVIFTSGATESDNLAIKGVIRALMRQGYAKPHVIATSIEHSAILEPCEEIRREGAEISYLPIKKNGVVDIEKFKNIIKDNTVLVSIMHVNNEVGSIQPIREIGEIINSINKKRSGKGAKFYKIYFHTDATQAVNFLNSDVKLNNVDLLSLSGHKIYGPKGVGALFIKSGTPIVSLQTGGHQEKNVRCGTLNVPGIVGLGRAVELLDKKSVEKNNKKIGGLRNLLVAGILKNIPKAILNTDRANAVPSHAHFSFLGAEGESMLISLDLAGIAVSTGSACASGSLEPSHVLLAMGIKKEICHNSIRFSLGKNTTEADIKNVIKIIPGIIKKLRKISPK